MKLTIFKHVAVLSGTGVGGGSSVYANTLPIPKSTFFKTGSWSKLHDLENELAPYYEEALRMPGGAKNPKLFDGAIGLKKVTQKLGMDDKFDATTVAIYFREENVTKKDPYFVGMGPERTGCHQQHIF
jgi:cholesterol oxidase